MNATLRSWFWAGLVLTSNPVLAQESPTGESDSEEMAEARAGLRKEHGGLATGMLLGERFEYGADDGDDFLLWDFQGWFGGDIKRLWIKTEGEYGMEPGRLEEGEIQALYSRAISPYFDLQAGVRQDFEPGPSRSYAVLGVQGLAPYWFELDAALFVSEEGDLTARVEAEYEILFTQRLIAQPRLELEVSAQEVSELGFGSGLSTVDFGLRLRYEIRREFAPYVGVSWTELVGGTADFARAAGEAKSSRSFVVGLRFWY
ncbi:MAG: copper resistance protein B [Acidobacteria bacterium]|nr:copper resistance protein B [Acidobacteriota bacterium]